MVSEPDQSEYRLTEAGALAAFVSAVLIKTGVAAEDAELVARVLVASDLRGIESHGVARLESYYVSRLRSGLITPRPQVQTLRETESSLRVDGGNGLGHSVSFRTMERVIEKAKKQGSAFAAVCNSNHFGIAGFYAMMALPHDMIGIASTNSVRYGAATFGRSIMLGTNPLAFAIPANKEPAFVFDAATTTVPRGKLEVYKRKEQALKDGWAIDVDGHPTTDPDAAIKGALLPLGGYGTEHGGHKGYGLGLLVDILCGVLAGGAFAETLPLPNGPASPGAISHFFGAVRVDGFRDVAEFKHDVDQALRQFKDSPKSPGFERIYVAGEIEHERETAHVRDGVPIHRKVWTGLESLGLEFDVPFTLAR